jgi:hypothetical protein
MSSRLRNLTLASAKHLLTMGHITKPHHDRIVATATALTLPKMPTMPKAPGGFGSLAKKNVAAPLPVPGMQASLPGVGGGSIIPPGLPPGYDETQ